MKEVPKTRWQRSRAMLGLAANVASKEVGMRLRTAVTGNASAAAEVSLVTRIEQAKAMAESLGRLKGALMKAGQLLSIEAGDFLPPEVLDALRSLQSDAEPVDFASMHGVLIADLGADKVAMLQGLDGAPAASASIGQVYRVETTLADGKRETLALKVQYPGVAESIDTDLKLLQQLGQSFMTLAGRKIELSDLFHELGVVLHYEADYVRERSCMLKVAGLVESDARFVVPRAHSEFSSARVLAMTWEEGVPLGDWVRSDPSHADRMFMAKAMLDLFCMEFFEWGLVQTDPNFGNFLVRVGQEGAPLKLVLLDFGATVEFDERFRKAYVLLLRAIGSRDRSRIAREGIAFGLLDDRESTETKELFVDLLLGSLEPFEAHRQPFVFNDVDYTRRARDIGQRFTSALRYSPPPRQLLFLHRKLGGIYQLLKRLDVVMDLRPYWDKMVG